LIELIDSKRRKAVSDIAINKDRLQDLMIRRGVNDGQVGQLADMSKGAIRYLRIGTSKTTSERNLRAIAKALDTTVEYLSSEGKPDREDDGQVAIVVDEPGRKLAEVASRLSAIRKQELVRIAEALLAMEREKSKIPLEPEAMDRLIAIYDQLRVFAGGADPLDSLEALLKNNGVFLSGAKPSNGLGNQGHNH
jgi:transcriptional regulator with XRE-family HTH domain